MDSPEIQDLPILTEPANPIKDNRDFLLKQSDNLQTVVARMATTSTELKKLAMTVWTALTGFGFTNHKLSLFFLAIGTVFLLGLLDVYYLYLERRFRRSFKQLAGVIAGLDNNAKDLFKSVGGDFITLGTLSRFEAFKIYAKAIKSWANLPYLLAIAAALVMIWKFHQP